MHDLQVNPNEVPLEHYNQITAFESHLNVLDVEKYFTAINAVFIVIVFQIPLHLDVQETTPYLHCTISCILNF